MYAHKIAELFMNIGAAKKEDKYKISKEVCESLHFLWFLMNYKP